MLLRATKPPSQGRGSPTLSSSCPPLLQAAWRKNIKIHQHHKCDDVTSREKQEVAIPRADLPLEVTSCLQHCPHRVPAPSPPTNHHAQPGNLIVVRLKSRGRRYPVIPLPGPKIGPSLKLPGQKVIASFSFSCTYSP